MTEIIDVNLIQSQSDIVSNSCSSNQINYFRKDRIKSIQHKFYKIVDHIHQNNIKTPATTLFELDFKHTREFDYFDKNKIKTYCLVSIKDGQFSVRVQLLDETNRKICAKSTHHRTLISSFVFEINAELQKFRLEYNPINGQFSFVFNPKVQSLDEANIDQLIKFSLNSYLEECQAHLYVLNLIEYPYLLHNQYLNNIQDHSIILKKWLLEKRNQRKRNNHQHPTQNSLCPNQTTNSIFQLQSPLHLHIKGISKYLSSQSKTFEIKKDLNSNIAKKFNKKFKNYCKDEDIFIKHLANKSKYKNLMNLQARNIKSFNDLFVPKMSQKSAVQQSYQISNKRSNNNQSINSTQKKYDERQLDQFKSENNIVVQDKISGKNYLVKLLFLGRDGAKKQELILQKLCKFETYMFFNQYLSLENLNLSSNGFVTVNIHPKRIFLSEFLQRNERILSFPLKIMICINLVEIFLTLNFRSKIMNYFPFISIYNLEISSGLSLTFAILSKNSIDPLYDLINTIHKVLFLRSISELKSMEKLVKGDEAQNKNWGVSTCIKIIKFYLLQLFQEALQIKEIKQSRQSKKLSTQQSQQIELWIRHRLTKSAHSLLVMFRHFENVFSRSQSEQYIFEEKDGEQPASDRAKIRNQKPK